MLQALSVFKKTVVNFALKKNSKISTRNKGNTENITFDFGNLSRFAIDGNRSNQH